MADEVIMDNEQHSAVVESLDKDYEHLILFQDEIKQYIVDCNLRKKKKPTCKL